MLFAIASTIKIVRNKFTREVKDIYNENYKSLKKENMEDGKISPAHGLAE
jgi:hypothetical protein